MKVLHFGRFYHSGFGGLERHVELLLDSLKDHITVGNLVANERFRTEVLRKNGYNIYKVASLGAAASTALCPTMPYWARKLHRREHYDIAPLHFPDPMSHLAAAFLPKEVKIVITWHSDIVRQEKLLKIYRPFLSKIIDRAHAIIAATPLYFSSSSQLSVAHHRKIVDDIPHRGGLHQQDFGHELIWVIGEFASH